MSYQQLTGIFARLADLAHIQAIVNWDEAVNMPEAAGAKRARALATLRALHHAQLTDPTVGALLAQVSTDALSDPWQQANLRLMQRAYQRAVCVPVDLVTEFTHATLCCEQAWRKLRADNDWQSFAPLLTENLRLVKQIAAIKSDALGQAPYDVLLDEFSPGLTQAVIDPVFTELKAFLPNFLRRVCTLQQGYDYRELAPPFAIDKQKTLGLQLCQQLGFDFNRGRLDVSHHPFCGGVTDDVRMTTRYNTQEFISAMMGVCHETGHALYEQGLPAAYYDQPVGSSLGMDIHESQSLLIEMQACRSQAFITYVTPLLQRTFPQLAGISAADLYAIYTRVRPGFIRVDADEVTYPLHIILRYELERDLFADKLSVADLPEAWDAGMQTLLGLSTRGNYRDGVMQDVHWPAGLFGYFPAYTLGALTAAQLFQAAQQQCSGLLTAIGRGDFSPLLTWLRTHVHSRASSISATELLTQATGTPLSARYFIQHLQQRYT